MGIKPIVVLKRGYPYSDGFETHRYDDDNPIMMPLLIIIFAP
jgi:hypothetical protein